MTNAFILCILHTPSSPIRKILSLYLHTRLAVPHRAAYSHTHYSHSQPRQPLVEREGLVDYTATPQELRHTTAGHTHPQQGPTAHTGSLFPETTARPHSTHWSTSASSLGQQTTWCAQAYNCSCLSTVILHILQPEPWMVLCTGHSGGRPLSA